MVKRPQTLGSLATGGQSRMTGTLGALLAAGAGPLLLALFQKWRQEPQSMQAPGYYSENFMGPTPQGSLTVPAMDPQTTGLVYEPARDQFVSPQAYGQLWGYRGGTAPRGDY